MGGRAHRERGSSYVEFLFVAPIALIIAASSVEFANYLKFRQIADVLSKEAAIEAYRTCDLSDVQQTRSGPVINTAKSKDQIQTCLDSIRTQVTTALSTAGLTNAKLILSVYRFDFSNIVPSGNCINVAPTRIISPSDSSGDSLFSVSGTSNTSNILRRPQQGGALVPAISGSDYGCKTGRVAIAELAFRYTPIINFRVIGVGGSFSTNLSQTSLRSDPTTSFSNAPREITIF